MNTAKNKNMLLWFGKWTKEELDRIMQETSKINGDGERIDFLSRKFLGVAYKASTLAGDANTPEKFVVNLEEMDCMTFIEYIEAMRLSGSFSEFMENLKKVRYSQGKIAFQNRNHFFTDWIDTVEDVTAKVGGSNTKKAQKRLNIKKDGGYIIQGIPCKDREIKYIPADSVDETVIDGLKTGDYVGIYSPEDGLDVSHVGIIVKGTVPVSLRHASSVVGKVVDEDLKKYIDKKEGIVVLRPCKQGGVGNKLGNIVGKVIKKEKRQSP